MGDLLVIEVITIILRSSQTYAKEQETSRKSDHDRCYGDYSKYVNICEKFEK